MKKLAVTLLACLVMKGAAFAQGTIAVYSINASSAMYTSSTLYNSSLNGVYNTTGTRTGTAANGFYYALLFQAPGASVTGNPLDSGWAVGMMATNYGVAGGIRGAGAALGSPVAGWGAPTGSTYASAELNNFLLVGWSSNLGATWAEVAAQLASDNWIADGFFGVSALGSAYAGGGPNSLPAVNILGVSSGAPGGLTGGITMYTVLVPEPTTIAFMALGGASLLLFRRRK